MINPFTSNHIATLKVFEINLRYDEYNILCFFIFKSKKNIVYYAVDRGYVCNCSDCLIHSPFFKYSGKNENEILKKLKKVKNIIECKKIFNDFVNSKKSMSTNIKLDYLVANLKKWGLK